MTGGLNEGIRHLENYLAMGGPVMVPLVIVSLVMWVLITDRVFFFKRMQCGNMTPQNAWEHICRQGLPDPEYHGGALAVLAADFLDHRGSDPAMDSRILDESIRKLNRRLTDYLPVIGVLAAIAPLLGLLGTVTGMMATFDVLAVFGTGNARAMANGISQALITTQTGLLVAIPGLYMKGFLDRRARNLRQRITAAGYYLRRHLCFEHPTCEDRTKEPL